MKINCMIVKTPKPRTHVLIGFKANDTMELVSISKYASLADVKVAMAGEPDYTNPDIGRVEFTYLTIRQFHSWYGENPVKGSQLVQRGTQS